MSELNQLKAFAIENANEVKGGEIATCRNNANTDGSEHYNNWYSFKGNNPTISKVERSHWGGAL
jgi:hypothetical protein